MPSARIGPRSRAASPGGSRRSWRAAAGASSTRTDRGCSIAGSVLGASLRGKVLEEVDGRGPTVAFVLGEGIGR